MSLGDWTQVNAAAVPTNLIISLEIAAPLVGNGSLKFVNLGTPTASANMYLTSLAKGFSKGRIRTLMQVKVRPNTGRYNGAGLCFLQSQLTIATTNANYYTFGLNQATSGAPGSMAWVLAKNTNHTLQVDPFGAIIDEATLETVAAGDYWPMQVQWIADVVNIGGTRITCSRGTKNSTDFNTLAVIIDTIDTISPFVTSVGEGLYDRHPHSGFESPSHEYVFDETTVYELT